MPYEKKTTHVVEALENLIDQFKDKPKIAATLTSWLNQIQELELVLSDLLTETTITTSIGQHLDNIGAIVGEPRSGRDDDQYRIAISARILLNKSSGTIEDVIGVLLAVEGSGAITITTTELFPAGFLMEINEPVDPLVTNVERLAAFISSARPAGVRGFLVYHPVDAFQFDGVDGTGFDEGGYGGAVPA